MIDQHASLGEKFLKKWIWLYVFSYIIAPIWYIVKILISWEVSVSELGILYGIISLITLLSAISDLGVGESLKYFIPQYVEKKQYSNIKSILAYSYIIQVFSGFILMFIFYFWADFLALHYFKNPISKDALQVFSLFFLWINAFNILSQFFLAVQNTFYYKLVEFIRNIALLLVTLGLVFYDISSLSSFASAWVIWLYAWLVIAMIFFFRRYYQRYLSWEKMLWSKKLFSEFFWYALVVFLSVQIGVILSQIDMQMVIYLLSTTDAWYYSVYLSLITIPFLIIGPIFSFLLPIFSELSAQKHYGKIWNLKTSLSNTLILAWMFFSFFLFTFSHDIAYVLFWETFILSGKILQFSCLFLICNFLLQINFNILWGLWRVSTKLKITSIALWINIVLNIVLLNMIWVAWAALATGIWWLIIFLLSEFSLRREYSNSYNLKSIWYNFLLLLSMSVSSYIILGNYFMELSRVWTLLAMLGFGILWGLLFSLLNRSYLTALFIEIKKLRA